MDDYDARLDKHLKEEADSILAILAKMKVSSYEDAEAPLSEATGLKRHLAQLPPEAVAHAYYFGFTMGWYEEKPGLIILRLMCIPCTAGAELHVTSEMLNTKMGPKETSLIVEWNALQRWLIEVPQCSHVMGYLLMQMVSQPYTTPDGLDAIASLLRPRLKALQQWGIDINADRLWSAPMPRSTGTVSGDDDGD